MRPKKTASSPERAAAEPDATATAKGKNARQKNRKNQQLLRKIMATRGSKLRTVKRRRGENDEDADAGKKKRIRTCRALDRIRFDSYIKKILRDEPSAGTVGIGTDAVGTINAILYDIMDRSMTKVERLVRNRKKIISAKIYQLAFVDEFDSPITGELLRDSTSVLEKYVSDGDKK